MKPITFQLIRYRVRDVQLGKQQYLIRRFVFAIYDPEEDAVVTAVKFEFMRLRKTPHGEEWRTVEEPQYVQGLVDEARREWT